MDIGFIIFLVIASAVGSMIKESKKQQEGKSAQSKTLYSKPKGNLQPKYNKQAKTVDWDYSSKESKPAVHIPVGNILINTFEQVGKTLIDENFSLEGQRKDIGETYETLDQEPHSLESIPETEETENMETQISYKRVEFEDEDDNYEGGMGERNYGAIGLNFDKESIVKGIILAEVLGPPRCRKR